jgi:hypothetical protein
MTVTQPHRQGTKTAKKVTSALTISHTKRLKCVEALVRDNAMNNCVSTDMEKFKDIQVNLNLLEYKATIFGSAS